MVFRRSLENGPATSCADRMQPGIVREASRWVSLAHGLSIVTRGSATGSDTRTSIVHRVQNMKSILVVSLATLLLLLGLSACASNQPMQAEWVDKLIARYEAAPVANPPHRIIRYRYHDQLVYYVPASCCDRPSTLYDASGDILCAPDGGITGRGDGRCADFRQSRSDESLVWSDPRSR